MKKLFLIAILFVTNLSRPNEAQAVSVEFGWGGFGLLGCTGSGICISCFPPRTSKVEVNFDVLTSQINFAVDETTIPNDKTDLFSGDAFVMDADFVLSDDICKALGVPLGTTLAKGSYPLTHSSGTYYFAIKI